MCTAVLLAGLAACKPSTPVDSAGRAVLVFEIDDEGLEDYPDLAEKMVRVLKKRLDSPDAPPLKWRVISRNRIEVEMPLPSSEVWKLRQAYFAARSALTAHNINRDELEAALTLTDGRAEKLQGLAHGSRERERLLLEAAAAQDEYIRAQPDAEARRADVIEDVLDTNFPLDQFDDVMYMKPNSTYRTEALNTWRRRFPQLSTQIDDAVTKCDAWHARRTYVDDPSDVKRLLRGVGVLEFRILAEPDPANPAKYDRYRQVLQERGPAPGPDDALGWFRVDNPVAFLSLQSPAELDRFDLRSAHIVAERRNRDYYVLAKLAPADGMLRRPVVWHVRDARRDQDTHGRWCVTFELDAAGGTEFERLTGANIGQPLCILLDDVALSAPMIRSRIQRHGQITGDFTLEKAGYLAQTLQAGALPARLKEQPVSERIELKPPE